MLFDESQPQSGHPKRYAEPAFSFLNRSNWPELEAVRSRLQSWHARYPESARCELATRFRSSDDLQHQSAFFELLLHEVLLRLGCTVETHPRDIATRNAPDFLAVADGKNCCIEAVVVKGESDEDRAAQRRMNEVYDVLNTMESPDFFLGLKIRGFPRTPPPARAIVSFLRPRLHSLDPVEAERTFAGAPNSQERPCWLYQHEGWKIEFFPIPKSERQRAIPGCRPIGVIVPQARWSTSRQSLQRALEKKAGKYGAQRMPYVIAVNVGRGDFDQTDVIEALFGSEVVATHQTSQGPQDRFVRERDGLWISRSGPRYTRVSGVLVFFGALPWALESTSVRLFINPWAEKSYDGRLNDFARCVVREGDLRLMPGIGLKEILNDADPLRLQT